MSYDQVRPFNQAQGGNVPNMCLANVTKGYGIPNRYASAWEAWQNTQQHAGSPPAGLDVPVYFSYFATIDGVYKNWGHIGVRLANGQFWSDGKLYSSINSYTANHSPVYVGWGESVNNGQVIKEGDNMLSYDDKFKWWRMVRREDPNPDEAAAFKNMDDATFTAHLWNNGGQDWKSQADVAAVNQIYANKLVEISKLPNVSLDPNDPGGLDAIVTKVKNLGESNFKPYSGPALYEKE